MSPTATISRDELVERITALPKPQRRVLAGRWTVELTTIPTLKQADDHTPGQLVAIDRLLREVETLDTEAVPPAHRETAARRAEVKPAVHDLRDRFKVLPPDIQRYVEDELIAKTGRDRTRLEDISDNELEVAADLLDQGDELAEHRRVRLLAMLGEAGLDGDDDRHDLLDQLSGGRTRTSKNVTAEEITHVADALARLATGLAVAVSEDGAPFRLVDGDGEPLPALEAPVVDWKARCKAWGIKLTDLLRTAKPHALAAGLAAPRKADDPALQHPDVVARLTAHFTAQTGVVAGTPLEHPISAAATPAAAVEKVETPVDPVDRPTADGGPTTNALVVIHLPTGLEVIHLDLDEAIAVAKTLRENT